MNTCSTCSHLEEYSGTRLCGLIDDEMHERARGSATRAVHITYGEGSALIIDQPDQFGCTLWEGK